VQQFNKNGVLRIPRSVSLVRRRSRRPGRSVNVAVSKRRPRCVPKPAQSVPEIAVGANHIHQPRAVGDEQRQQVTFLDNTAGRFKDCRGGDGAYGGLWTENVVSGTSLVICSPAAAADRAAGTRRDARATSSCARCQGFGSLDEFSA
jgi:hypothetical protein